jgi:hypothetical protein
VQIRFGAGSEKEVVELQDHVDLMWTVLERDGYRRFFKPANPNALRTPDKNLRA